MNNLYFQHSGEYKPIGKVIEISTTEMPEMRGEYPDIRFTDTELTFRLTLDRKSKKTFAKFFIMPRWKRTEWMFPRKKKRASKRRKRRNQKKQKPIQRDVLPETVKKIISRKLHELWRGYDRR